MKEIWSVGHSTRTLEELLDLLKHYKIKIVVDVRRFPTSKKYPWFRRENLEKALKKEGLEYIWLGDRLGGYRKGGYENYMKSAEFMEGVSHLEKIASRDRTVFLCAEKLPFRCHRRFISDELVRRGWRVNHIIEKGRLYVKNGIPGIFA